MKTININLIGNLGKTVRKTEKQESFLKNEIDSNVKHKAFLIIGASCAIFALAFFVWLCICLYSQNLKTDLKKINTEIETLKPQLEDMKLKQENAQNTEKELEAKMLIKNQLSNSSLSWKRILLDISSVVPQQIKITEINQLASKKEEGASRLEVKGQINSDKQGALRLISYMVFNINENLPETSYLKDATIEKIKFDDNTGLYEFSVIAEVQKNTESVLQKDKN